jgi:hypothetical protein
MENYKLIYTIIKTAVETGIRYIEDNPKRGIRNLLDLGEYFASSPSQKSFFNLAHDLLKNENSHYYDILDTLVQNTNHKTLTDYGVNIGYNSLLYGANIIREHKKEHGFNVPWVIVFNFEKKDDDNLTNEEILDIINSGKNNGIYSYMILLGKNNILDDLYDVFEKNDKCAFTLFIDPSLINEKTVKKISSISNICIFVSIDNYEKSNFSKPEEFDLLNKYKCLYGGYCCYDNSSTINISNGTITDKLLSLNLNFAFCIRKNNCSKEAEEITSDFIYKSRIEINSPVILIDFYSDLARISKIISMKSCFLSIDGRGQIYTSDIFNKTEYNIRNNSLENILSYTMPKVNSD